MKLASVHSDDLVEISKGGRRVYGRVVEIRDGVVRFEPLCRGISYRHASAREIIGHWRKTGRHGPGPASQHDEQPQPMPREQLPLPMADDLRSPAADR